jgi:hypothetical protein
MMNWVKQQEIPIDQQGYNDKKESHKEESTSEYQLSQKIWLANRATDQPFCLYGCAELQNYLNHETQQKVQRPVHPLCAQSYLHLLFHNIYLKLLYTNNVLNYVIP